MNLKTLIALTLVTSPFARDARTATLPGVPMQGGMVMPMISYNAQQNRLSVMMDPAIPELTPLLVSNPADDFDPADPWYPLLSPARQGLAFSRRYGFVMDAMTDPLPSGVQMWIRKLSSTPGLAAYRDSTSEPKAFEPIFGTGGSSDARPWSGMMFHPAFTAAPGTNEHSATFEVYLADESTGAEIENSGTGAFELRWTNLPDPRPLLAINNGLNVSWPANATNYVLESAEMLPSQNWQMVTNTPELTDERLTITLEQAWAGKFLRLRRTP